MDEQKRENRNGTEKKVFRNKRMFRIFLIVIVGMCATILVSLWSLRMMAVDNTKEVDMMLASRAYDLVDRGVSEPITLARAVARDQYLIDTLKNESELGAEGIEEDLAGYMQSLQSGFGCDSVSIVSAKTKQYYTLEGADRKVNPAKEPRDAWYDEFVKKNVSYDMDLGSDSSNDEFWMIYVNSAIRDEDGELLGVCEMGIRTANLQSIFRSFEENYNVDVRLEDPTGKVIIDADSVNFTDVDLTSSGVPKDDEFVYNFAGNHRLIITKYVQTFGWNLIIESDDRVINQDFIRVIVVNVVVCLILIGLTLTLFVIAFRRATRESIAKEKQNEQLLSMAEIYRSVHDVDLLSDTFSEILVTNERVAKTVGENRENAQQTIQTVMDQLTADSSKGDIQRFIDFSTLQERMGDQITITQEFLNTENLWLRARFIASKRTSDGRLSHVLWLVESIDEQKRNSELLEKSAQNLADQVTTIAGIYMSMHELNLDDDTFIEIKAQSKMVTDVIGSKRTGGRSLLRQVMESVTDPSCIVEMRKFIDFSSIDERMREINVLSIEYLNRDKFWRRGRFIPTKRTAGGHISKVLWVVEDIDQERRDRDKLVDISERAIAASEAKSYFLSNMSHEIRTPIGTVLGMNEMILRESDDPNILAYSDTIRTAGNSLLGIINDILDFSKIEAGKMDIVPANYDLASLINDLVNMVKPRAEQKRLTLTLDIDRQIPKELNGDEIRIKQVITNLLTNAVKYTEKGSIVFSVGYKKLSRDPECIALTVSVKDTGIGIKEEDMSRLFSEFERIEEKRNRNIEGTGLGMNITKNLLEMMGSSLKVESIYGLGSRFSFNLKQRVVNWAPLGDYEATYRESVLNRKKYHERFVAPDAYILAVDDNDMNLMVFRNFLKKTQVQIDTVSSGAECLDLSMKKKYDAIFLDDMMPDMGGVETLQKMREMENNVNARTPVVCLTANAISGAKEHYIEEGFDDYLTKPINGEALEEQLLRFIPPEKIVDAASGEGGINRDPVLPATLRTIKELDVESGIKNSGGDVAYLETLIAFSKSVPQTAEEIEKYIASDNIKDATIKIHALKSNARIIGALELGDLAQQAEDAGKSADKIVLKVKTDAVLSRCRKLAAELSKIKTENEADDSDFPLISYGKLKDIYRKMADAAEDCDSVRIEEQLDELKGYRLPKQDKEKIRVIRKATEEFDFKTILKVLQK